MLDPDLLSENSIEDYELLITPIDFRVAEGLYYEVRQYSLSPGAHQYWNNINILSEREGNMFDRPVGEIESNLVNISDEEDVVFGYFFATDEQIIGIRVPSELVLEQLPLCPPPGPCLNPIGECICGICCNCLLLENATTVKPDYWID